MDLVDETVSHGLQVREGISLEGVNSCFETTELQPSDFLSLSLFRSLLMSDLVHLRHEKIHIVAWQGHFQIGLDQPEIGRIAVQPVNADDQVQPLTVQEANIR